MTPPPSPAAWTATGRAATARRRLRALVWRSRPLVVALGCGLVATVVVERVSPPPPATRPVVVTARDVEAGAVLDEADVALVRVATTLAPEAALTRVSDAVGRTTSVALPPDLTITPSLVAAGDLAATAPEGTVVAPVRLSDPTVAALLHPGDRVDLLGTTDPATGAGAPLARRALVLAGAPADAAPGGLLGGNDPEGGLTLVAVRPEEAAALAGIGEWGALAVVLVP